MTYLDEGLFYYDFTVPNVQGVYIVSAYCTLPSLNQTSHITTEDWETNTFDGGTGNWSGFFLAAATKRGRCR